MKTFVVRYVTSDKELMRIDADFLMMSTTGSDAVEFYRWHPGGPNSRKQCIAAVMLQPGMVVMEAGRNVSEPSIVATFSSQDTPRMSETIANAVRKHLRDACELHGTPGGRS